jgi:hypothetical protein
MGGKGGRGVKERREKSEREKGATAAGRGKDRIVLLVKGLGQGVTGVFQITGVFTDHDGKQREGENPRGPLHNACIPLAA